VTRVSPEATRLLRLAGSLAWLGVVSPALLQGIGGPTAFSIWLTGLLAFGALFAWSTRRLNEPATPALWGILAGEAVCVVTSTAVQCRGYEGSLLVLIAMQLGLVAPRRAGLAWVGGQTLAMAWAIQHHWSPGSALLLTPPYLGFQVLAFLVVEALGREHRARVDLAQALAELLSTRELLAENARLSERLRIGRDLHDAMGHNLAALSLNLEALAPGDAAPPAPLGTARRLVRQLLDDVESVVTAVNEDRGIRLGQALAALASAVPRPVIHLEAPDLALREPALALVLLRCCQEIVTNSVKHASAANLWISIRAEDGAIQLEARDDGEGAASVGRGHGLAGMRLRLEEAGGALDYETRPGAGFHLRATLPLGSPARPARRTASASSDEAADRTGT
jgi:signal transduction histidine kinase